MTVNDETEDGNWVDDDPRRAEFERSSRLLRSESLTGVSTAEEIKARMLEMLEARILETKAAGCSLAEFNRRYGKLAYKIGTTPRRLAMELSDEQKILVLKDKSRNVLVHAEGYFRLIEGAAEASSAAELIAYVRGSILEQSP